MSKDWIYWEGGECPVPAGTLVDVKHRDGSVYYNQTAGLHTEDDNEEDGYAENWDINTSSSKLSSGDIIAYRIVNKK